MIERYLASVFEKPVSVLAMAPLGSAPSSKSIKSYGYGKRIRIDYQAAGGLDVAVLEADALRKVLTTDPRYDREERDTFYRQMAYIGVLLTRHGVPVIFDATANRRAYRDQTRQQIPRFLEVYVDCPLATCMARDPKRFYRKAREDQSKRCRAFRWLTSLRGNRT
jgi:hypothetical protein